MKNPKKLKKAKNHFKKTFKRLLKMNLSEEHKKRAMEIMDPLDNYLEYLGRTIGTNPKDDHPEETVV